MTYGLSDARRATTLSRLESWIRLGSLHGLYVDTVTGRGKARQQTQVGELDAEYIAALGSPDAIVDDVIEAHGAMGGTLQLRACFTDDAGVPQWEGQRRCSFTLTRVAAPGAGKGGPSAVEGIASTLSSVAASGDRRVEDLHQRVQELTLQFIGRSEASQEQRFADVMLLQGANADLRIQLVESELRAELADRDRDRGIPPEVWVQLVSAILPSVNEAVGLGVRWLGARVTQAEETAGLLEDSTEPEPPAAA